MRKKIIAVCMLDGIHAARWLAQFQDQPIDFLLFPSSPNRRIHPLLVELLENSKVAKYQIFPLARFLGLPLWITDQILRNVARGSLLAATIRIFRPDTVHALELTNAGYIALKAVRILGAKSFELISTNWGSDIHWFQQFPAHRKKLVDLLAETDKYSCECQRDVELAKRLGFTGVILPVIPNAGGFKAELFQASVPVVATRKLIVVKGYHGWAGRAKVALSAIARLSSELRDFEIVVYSANATTIRFAKRVRKDTGLKISVFPKFKLSHEEVLSLMARAKIYVGLSVTDGISTSMLEAMTMGAIPIQTATACCDEWFTDSGVAVKEITVDSVARAIKQGLNLAQNQDLSDKNRLIVREKADADEIAAVAKGFYSN